MFANSILPHCTTQQEQNLHTYGFQKSRQNSYPTLCSLSALLSLLPVCSYYSKVSSGRKKTPCVHACRRMFSFRAEGIFSFVPKLRFSLSVANQTYARQTEAVPSSSSYNYVAHCNLATPAAVFALFLKYGIVPCSYLEQASRVELTAKLKKGTIHLLFTFQGLMVVLLMVAYFCTRFIRSYGLACSKEVKIIAPVCYL